MTFHEVAEEYIAYKQSLGMTYGVQARNLRIFARACAGRDISDVTPKLIREFLSRQTPFMRTRHYQNLRPFYRFAVTREYVTQSPLPDESPKMPPHAKPYIYPRDELKRLFAEALNFRTIDGDPLFGITFRTLLILLYGAALRRNEALLLKGADVDLAENVLTIRNSKFGKTRLVPIGSQLSEVLSTYVAERLRLHRPVTPDAHFFSTIKYPFLKERYVNDAFRRLCARLGIHREDSGRFQPRLHDLRHTFVAHRIEAEYESQQDLQRLLEELPTYLGHLGLVCSQQYMTLTPTILAAANQRFSQFALTEVAHVANEPGQ